jgi:PAS domain S-box-containing protein
MDATLPELQPGEPPHGMERSFRALFEASLDAVLLTAPDGRIFAANPAACRMFARSEAEIVRLGRNGIVDVADPRLAIALAEREHTGRFCGELTFIRGNGDRFPGEISTALFRDPNGELRTSMVIRDITERKRAESALRESEAILDRAQALAHVGHWSRDLTANTVQWSDETYRIFGRPPQTGPMDARTFFDAVHPDDRERVARSIADALAGIRAYDVEYRLLRPGGTIRHVHALGEVVSDRSGRPLQLFGCVADITARKQVEAALRASEAELATAQRIAHVGSPATPCPGEAP